MAGLAGLGVGGAVGGLVGALVGMGIPEYEAKRYRGACKGWWHSAFRPLRYVSTDKSGQGIAEIQRCGRYFV